MGQPKIPPTPHISLAGKTALITGGNSGLGLETARQFLLLGLSHLVITARNSQRGDAAVEALRDCPEVKAKNPKALIEAYEVELEDWISVTRFCQRTTSSLQELHLFVQNAGVTYLEHRLCKTGHEITMQVNSYSPFVISMSLLPLLRSTAHASGQPSRLTFVGSSMHYRHTLSKQPIASHETVVAHFDAPASGLVRYCDSKLLVNAFIRELATKVPANEVIVNSACPGFVTTALGRDFPAWMKPVMYLYRWVSARDVEEGARAIVFASSVAGPKTHGKFLQHNVIDPGAAVLDQPEGITLREMLWTEMVTEANVLHAD